MATSGPETEREAAIRDLDMVGTHFQVLTNAIIPIAVALFVG
jgi:hypothetical protein